MLLGDLLGKQLLVVMTVKLPSLQTLVFCYFLCLFFVCLFCLFIGIVLSAQFSLSKDILIEAIFQFEPRDTISKHGICGSLKLPSVVLLRMVYP